MLFPLLFFFFLASCFKFPLNSQPYLFMGTGGDGYGVGGQFPGAQVPQGAMRLSPDTGGMIDIALWRYVSGYYFYDDEIRCFSHLRTVGAGALDWGTIGIMPTRLPIQTSTVTLFGYRSKYNNKNQTALPGYYSTHLETPNIFAEMTATTTAGIHRYTPQESGPWSILFDMSHVIDPKSCSNNSISIIGNNALSGHVTVKGALTGRCHGGQKIYFYAISSRQFSNFGVWNGTGNVFHQERSASSLNCMYESVGGYISFQTSSPTEIRIALSWISIEQAKLNLDQQIQDQTFQTVVNKASSLWDTVFSKIDIQPRPDQADDVSRFYTGLYNAWKAPTTYSESGGVYRGMDMQVHTLDSSTAKYLSDQSLWDVYRTQIPLFNLIAPEESKNVFDSLNLMYQQGGVVPRWPAGYCYSGSMSGTNVNNILVDAIQKGIYSVTDPVVESLYQGLFEQSTKNIPHGRSYIEDWIKYGFIPQEDGSKTASLTLEYAYNDYAIGVLGQLLGKPKEINNVFFQRSQNFHNTWSVKDKVFCAKWKNGTLNCPIGNLVDYPFDTNYEEGDAAQYAWFVPHDTKSLITLFGGKDAICSTLNSFIEKSTLDNSTDLPNPYLWLGNEPDIQVPWMGSAFGCPQVTQKWIPPLLRKKYSLSPIGIPGNDDYGAMSSWSVFAHLGLYPLNLGSNEFVIGSPIFPKATIHIPKTRSRPASVFTIITHNNISPEFKYVCKTLLNGEPYDSSTINFSKMLGSTLELTMSASPQC